MCSAPAHVPMANSRNFSIVRAVPISSAGHADISASLQLTFRLGQSIEVGEMGKNYIERA